LQEFSLKRVFSKEPLNLFGLFGPQISQTHLFIPGIQFIGSQQGLLETRQGLLGKRPKKNLFWRPFFKGAITENSKRWNGF